MQYNPDFATTMSLAIISVLLISGGIIALVCSYKLFVRGIGSVKDDLSIKAVNLELQPGSVGTAFLALAVAGWFFAYIGRPTLVIDEDGIKQASLGDVPDYRGNDGGMTRLASASLKASFDAIQDPVERTELILQYAMIRRDACRVVPDDNQNRCLAWLFAEMNEIVPNMKEKWTKFLIEVPSLEGDEASGVPEMRNSIVQVVRG